MTRNPKFVCPKGHLVKRTCQELTIEPLHWFCKDCRSTYTDEDVTPKEKVKPCMSQLTCLQGLINGYSKENESNTPDFILARYIERCLDAFDEATRARDKWYGSRHGQKEPLS